MTLNYSLNTVFFIWRRDGASYNRTFVGTVEAIDAYAAAKLARQTWGGGRYQVRQSKWGAPILAHA